MSNKYKNIGVLGSSFRFRTDKTWIVTFPDGEEVKFNNLRHAIMGFKAALGQRKNVKLEEETLIRFSNNCKINDKKFRIDMTERVKLMMSIKSKLILNDVL